ncbi:MAG TPA: TIGR04255 family protein [Beijerinckiaceae bacterium]
MKFQKPPLDELVIGVHFPPLLSLQAQHIGLFWAHVLKDLPGCTQVMPLGDEIISAEDEVIPLQRFWFVSRDEANLIQLQKSAFIANWRRRPEGPGYPHYENVKGFFDEKFATFQAFLGKTGLGEIKVVSHLEMAYINFLTLGGLNSLVEPERLMPGLSLLSSSIGELAGFRQLYTLSVSSDLALRIDLSHAQRITDGAHGLKLEIRAQGIPDPPETSAVADWFDRAHTHIGDLFLSLVSSELQESWGPCQD